MITEFLWFPSMILVLAGSSGRCLLKLQKSSSGDGSMRKAAITAGQRFSRLTVLIPAVQTDKHSNVKALFRCDCGIEKLIYVNGVRSGKVKSCGCLSKEASRKRATTHGKSNSTLYAVWEGIKARCLNKNAANYKNYGGRGIKLCERWMDFAAFDFDIGSQWAPGLEIDRINNDGDYEPGNCRWVTHQENSSNTRRCRHVDVDGKRGTVSQVARELGIPIPTIAYRTKSGRKTRRV